MKQQGFTLLEILIAVALMATLLTATVMVGAHMTGDIKRAEQNLRSAENIAAAFGLMEADFDSYYDLFKAPSRLQMSFKTLSPINSESTTESGHLHVMYSVEPHEGGQGVTLFRHVKDVHFVEEGIKTEILSADEIRFFYINDNDEDLSAWITKGLAPVAVQIEVKDKKEQDWIRTLPIMTREGYE